MKEAIIIPCLTFCMNCTGQPDIQPFVDLYPEREIESRSFDPSAFQEIINEYDESDTIPSTIYNQLGLYHLVRYGERPLRVYQGKNYKCSEVGTFIGGPEYTEVYDDGRVVDRVVLYYKGIYPVLKATGIGHINIITLRREAGYGIVEWFVYNDNKLISALTLLEGQVDATNKMKWAKITSSINPDGSITQIIDDGVELHITREIRKRNDGVFEIVKQSIGN